MKKIYLYKKYVNKRSFKFTFAVIFVLIFGINPSLVYAQANFPRTTCGNYPDGQRAIVENRMNQLRDQINPLQQELDNSLITNHNRVVAEPNLTIGHLRAVRTRRSEAMGKFHRLNKLYTEYYSLLAYLKNPRYARMHSCNLEHYSMFVNFFNQTLDVCFAPFDRQRNNPNEQPSASEVENYWNVVRAILFHFSHFIGFDISQRCISDTISQERFLPLGDVLRLSMREAYNSWNLNKFLVLTVARSNEVAVVRAGGGSEYLSRLFQEGLTLNNINTLFESYSRIGTIELDGVGRVLAEQNSQTPTVSPSTDYAKGVFDKRNQRPRYVLELLADEEPFLSLGTVVKNSMRDIYNIPERNIIVLKNTGDNIKLYPTKANIESTLRELNNRISHEEVSNQSAELLVFVAAHGGRPSRGRQFGAPHRGDREQQEGDYLGRLFLVESDLAQQCYSWEGERLNDGLSEFDFKEIIQSNTSNFSRVAVLLESCHSGNFRLRESLQTNADSSKSQKKLSENRNKKIKAIKTKKKIIKFQINEANASPAPDGDSQKILIQNNEESSGDDTTEGSENINNQNEDLLGDEENAEPGISVNSEVVSTDTDLEDENKDLTGIEDNQTIANEDKIKDPEMDEIYKEIIEEDLEEVSKDEQFFNDSCSNNSCEDGCSDNLVE